MAADQPGRRRTSRWPIVVAVVLVVLLFGAVFASWLILHQQPLHPVPISSASQG